MVTKERKWMPIEMVTTILKDKKASPEEKLEKLEGEMKNLPIRQPKQQPPEGGISIREVSRKYGIPKSNLSRWAKKGVLKIIFKVKNWLYLDEKSLVEFLRSRRGNGEK